MRNHSACLFLTLYLLVYIFVGFTYGQNSKENGARTIYLIRHGYYDEKDERGSEVGKELTPLGIAQARLVAVRLKSMQINFNSLMSSTFTRARQTAMVINEDFPELQLIQSPLISECTPPTWKKEIMTEADSMELYNCVENLEMAYKEIFIPSPDKDDRNDIVVCHGNVIRFFVTKVLMVDPMSWLQMSIGNCSLTIVRIFPDGQMKLDTFSDTGHIPPNMQTKTGGNNDSKELIVPVNK